MTNAELTVYVFDAVAFLWVAYRLGRERGEALALARVKIED